MISTNKIQQIKSLHQKKFRREQNKYIVETPKLVETYLRCRMPIDEVFATADWIENNWKKFASYTITEVSSKELERISSLTTPNTILATVEIAERTEISHWYNHSCLLLDDINDPGNLGTIIRLADWFGIDGIICSENSAEYTNPKAVQASMGSLVNVDVLYTNPSDFISNYKGSVYGTFMEGKSIHETKFNDISCFVIGNEAHGINPSLNIAEKISIPCRSTNEIHAESLNAAMATAIVLSEFRNNKNTQ